MLPKLTPLCRRRRRRRQRCTVHCQRVPPVLSGPPFTVPNECTALWRLACLQQLLLRVSEIDDAWHKIAGKIQSRPDLPITRDDQHASALCPRRSRAAICLAVRMRAQHSWRGRDHGEERAQGRLDHFCLHRTRCAGRLVPWEHGRELSAHPCDANPAGSRSREGPAQRARDPGRTRTANLG